MPSRTKTTILTGASTPTSRRLLSGSTTANAISFLFILCVLQTLSTKRRFVECLPTDENVGNSSSNGGNDARDHDDNNNVNNSNNNSNNDNNDDDNESWSDIVDDDEISNHIADHVIDHDDRAHYVILEGGGAGDGGEDGNLTSSSMTVTTESSSSASSSSTSSSTMKPTQIKMAEKAAKATQDELVNLDIHVEWRGIFSLMSKWHVQTLDPALTIEALRLELTDVTHWKHETKHVETLKLLISPEKMEKQFSGLRSDTRYKICIRAVLSNPKKVSRPACIKTSTRRVLLPENIASGIIIGAWLGITVVASFVCWYKHRLQKPGGENAEQYRMMLSPSDTENTIGSPTAGLGLDNAGLLPMTPCEEPEGGHHGGHGRHHHGRHHHHHQQRHDDHDGFTDLPSQHHFMRESVPPATRGCTCPKTHSGTA